MPRESHLSAAKLINIYRELSDAVGSLSFRLPVSHVYNPLEYARVPAEQYLEQFGAARKQVLFLGMNPGPWGMAQTGVPFGEVGHVRDWLKIDAPIGAPEREHPKRVRSWGSSVRGAR